MVDGLRQAAGEGPAGELLDGLFGSTRRLYKRLAQYSFFQQQELYDQLARRPYAWLAACGEQFAAVASTALGCRVAPHEVLFDAPPVKREIEFEVEIFFAKGESVSAAGGGVADRQIAGQRAVRRLREAGADFCSSAGGRRAAAAGESAGAD